jgi:hypothetical protein
MGESDGGRLPADDQPLTSDLLADAVDLGAG